MIPDFMPMLRHGSGRTPQEGGCLIQVAGFLNDGVSWTDETPCVHPMLRSVAITVNDTVLDDRDRQRLLEFVPRLIGTGLTGVWAVDEPVMSAMVGWCVGEARRLFPVDSEAFWSAEDGRRSYQGAMWADRCSTPPQKGSSSLARENAGMHARFVAGGVAHSAMAMADVHLRTDAGTGFLNRMIDEYDRLTGRTTAGKTVTEADWRRVTEHMKVNA